MSEDTKPKRVPVDYVYEAINPTFLKWMARIGAYASEKYGAWDQYKHERLVGEKSPINHAYEHLRSYQMGEPYDRFDGDVRWHLVGVAYNAMMEFFYCTKFGHLLHPLNVEGAVVSLHVRDAMQPGLHPRAAVGPDAR